MENIPMPDKPDELYKSELCTLRREYFVALAVLREAIKTRTAQYRRDRAALDAKYHVTSSPLDDHILV